MLPPPPRSTLFPYTTLFRSVRFRAGSAPVLYLGDPPGITKTTRRQMLDAVAKLRSEEHTSELQSLTNLVCRLLLEKKKNTRIYNKDTQHRDHDTTGSADKTY